MKPTIETAEEVKDAGEVGQLSYRQLIWRRFRKNRMGVIAGVLLLVFYILRHRRGLLRTLPL